eukprot:Nk52_evm10s521 gene=Nk52_evmTU10s521
MISILDLPEEIIVLIIKTHVVSTGSFCTQSICRYFKDVWICNYPVLYRAYLQNVIARYYGSEVESRKVNIVKDLAVLPSAEWPTRYGGDFLGGSYLQRGYNSVWYQCPPVKVRERLVNTIFSEQWEKTVRRMVGATPPLYQCIISLSGDQLLNVDELEDYLKLRILQLFVKYMDDSSEWRELIENKDVTVRKYLESKRDMTLHRNILLMCGTAYGVSNWGRTGRCDVLMEMLSSGVADTIDQERRVLVRMNRGSSWQPLTSYCSVPRRVVKSIIDSMLICSADWCDQCHDVQYSENIIAFIDRLPIEYRILHWFEWVCAVLPNHLLWQTLGREALKDWRSFLSDSSMKPRLSFCFYMCCLWINRRYSLFPSCKGSLTDSEQKECEFFLEWKRNLDLLNLESLLHCEVRLAQALRVLQKIDCYI